MKIDWIKKLTSRKFWLAVANFVTMLIIAFGGTENEAAQIASIIMAGATVVAYIIGEGLVDSFNNTGDEYNKVINIDTDSDDGK